MNKENNSKEVVKPELHTDRSDIIVDSHVHFIPKDGESYLYSVWISTPTNFKTFSSIWLEGS